MKLDPRDKVGHVLSREAAVNLRVWPGDAHPLGATWDGEGVNFALFSQHAKRRRALPVRFGDCRTRVASRSAARAHEPDLARLPARRASRAALRLSRARPLRSGAGPSLQSAQAAARSLRAGDRRTRSGRRRRSSATSSGDAACRSVVQRSGQRAARTEVRGRRPAFTWGDDRPPQTPWSRTVIYECHVRGMTMRHPQVPERLRGTLPGPGLRPDPRSPARARRDRGRAFADPPCVTRRARLAELGLANYWGYDTIGYFRARSALRDGRARPAGRPSSRPW